MKITSIKVIQCKKYYHTLLTMINVCLKGKLSEKIVKVVKMTTSDISLLNIVLQVNFIIFGLSLIWTE